MLARSMPNALILSLAIEAGWDCLRAEYIDHEVSSYLRGVFEGRAQPVEKYTNQIHACFTALRAVLPTRVHVYRGEPVKPPQHIQRQFLSWATTPALAARFAKQQNYHVVHAVVNRDDIVGGYTYSLGHDGPTTAQVELFVRARREYHADNIGPVPRLDWVSYKGLADKAKLLRLITKLGGRVALDKPRHPRDDDYWSGYPYEPGHGTLMVTIKDPKRMAWLLRVRKEHAGGGYDPFSTGQLARRSF